MLGIEKTWCAMVVSVVGVSGFVLAAGQRQEPIEEAAPAAELGQLAWLTGHWGGEEKGRLVEEIWTDGAGGSMFGINRTIAGGKLREFEFLRIAEKDGRLAYLASPGGRFPPTVFPLGKLEGSSVTFENLEHDFPQKIEYRLVEDTLHVRVSGKMSGKESALSWQWKRKDAK